MHRGVQYCACPLVFIAPYFTNSMFLLKARELEEKLSSLQDQLASTEAEKVSKVGAEEMLIDSNILIQVSLEAECEVMRRELNDKNIVMVKNNKVN